MDDLSLESRRTDELVIGLVAPVASGASTSAKILCSLFEREFDYTTHYIRVSELLSKTEETFGATIKDLPGGNAEPPHTRISRLQGVGDKLRERFGPGYLAEKVVEKIALDRVLSDVGGYADAKDDRLVAIPRRRVHIIDALKHPREAGLLREVYGDTFWLFGIFAPEEVRRYRLIRLGHNSVDLPRSMERDEEEGLEHGQKVRDTIHESDFFVRNDGISEGPLERTLKRYLSILFGVGINTPTLDEVAMYSAASQASSSACLSRQVGAAIYSKAGELIGVGANDVPNPLVGGLYCAEDRDGDHRCFRVMGGICHNDHRKSMLYNAIFHELKEDGVLAGGVRYPAVEAALRRTDIRNLIEYSRDVHAEMEAIISVARGNKPGLLGASLYATTFPCHNCARHIVASGIAKVVYIEPYTKSLALTLHGDAISLNVGDAEKESVFLQYEGVAPKNFIRLFPNGQARKAEGKLVTVNPRGASPVLPSPLDGFSTREQIILKALHRTEQTPAGQNKSDEDVVDGSKKGPPGPTQLSLVDPK